MKIRNVEISGNNYYVGMTISGKEIDQLLYDLEAARRQVPTGTQLATRLWRYWKKVHSLVHLRD